ncbi:membrane-spanning 4-domains subfamily A member 10 [Onychostoma macrolepis]|uniref:Uncharacterized protein n=1 Tax=Onychostoma macrolepis TaxID=369639 RepID=A0A7J6CTD1_9TELE|nr:membrane-spanning 4-domains subfamily A member 10 [Onychostoma macrolepis]KAF4110607.1 hypothetical protein G5714_007638 [Onychostoma macrolepis]
MSLTVSQDEGVTMITINSNPNSKCPILCQILGSLCYSPVCAVSQHVKSTMMDIYMALGIVQIIAGVLNLVTGILFISSGMHDHIMMFNAPFWLGGVFLVVGVVSIVADQFPSYFLVLVTVVLNKVSALLAMIGLALYAWDLMGDKITSSYYYGDNMIREALDITMMIISALQLCVTLSFSVLTLKRLCETNSVEDLQLYKPLKEVPVSHVC